jgi:YidC/Oxa1 family membrane protein insertase
MPQYISQKAISPPQSQDPAQQQTQAILKFLPLMIGWFSLNVPSGLTLYWFTNNLITTAQQLYLRRSFQAAQGVVGGGAAAAGAVVDVEAQEVEKKPSGEAAWRLCSSKKCFRLCSLVFSPWPPLVLAVLSPVCAARAITGKELNARRSPKQLEAAAAGGDAAGGRGEKFRAIKAREAAARAASQVRSCFPATVCTAGSGLPYPLLSLDC